MQTTQYNCWSNKTESVSLCRSRGSERIVQLSAWNNFPFGFFSWYWFISRIFGELCVCAFSSFWQRTADLGLRHVIPAGCESPVGGDRWSKFFFALVYNSDRQGEEQRASDSTTEGNAIIEIAKKTSKKKKKGLQSWGDTKNWKYRHSQEDEKEQEIEYLLVCPYFFTHKNTHLNTFI